MSNISSQSSSSSTIRVRCDARIYPYKCGICGLQSDFFDFWNLKFIRVTFQNSKNGIIELYYFSVSFIIHITAKKIYLIF